MRVERRAEPQGLVQPSKLHIRLGGRQEGTQVRLVGSDPRGRVGGTARSTAGMEITNAWATVAGLDAKLAVGTSQPTT